MKRTRGGARRYITSAAFAVALATAAWQFPGAFLSVARELRALRSATQLERELSGARRVDVDTRVFVEARRLIPENATYTVVTGPNVSTSSRVTVFAVRPFAAYWLMPRRRVPDTIVPDWVVSYGGDLGSLGLAYERVVEVAPGIRIAEVRR